MPLKGAKRPLLLKVIASVTLTGHERVGLWLNAKKSVLSPLQRTAFLGVASIYLSIQSRYQSVNILYDINIIKKYLSIYYHHNPNRLWMCSHLSRERRVGREQNPEGRQCWWWESWRWVCQASLAAACLSGSWWSTDRWRLAPRAVWVCLREGQAWWCWRPSWISQIRSLLNSQVCPGVAGCNEVPYWQHHPQTSYV